MSRLPIVLGLAAVAVGTYAAIHYLKDSYELIPMNTTLQKPTQAEQFADWYEYTDPAGKFKVRLPLLPQQASQQVTDPETGQRREYSMFVAQTQSETIYMVSLITFEPKEEAANEEKTIRALVDGMVSANQGNKLSYLTKASFQNHSAYDFEITNDQNIINGKTFLNENTLYVLTMINKNGTNGEAAFKHFTDSFTLEKGPVKPLVPFPSSN